MRFLLLLLVITPCCGYSQAPLTIGEIYNYQVGDEFHRTPSAYPNSTLAYRSRITDKWYSTMMDTVFYEIYHFDDGSYLNNSVNPPLWVAYPLPTYTDTISYTYLDSAITFNYDTTDYDWVTDSSGQYCDSIVTRIWKVPPYWDNEQKHSFGKGLGKVLAYQGSSLNPPSEDWELAYFYKGGSACGTPLVASVNEPQIHRNIIIYPNPSSTGHFLVEGDGIDVIEVVDLVGKTILSTRPESKTVRIDLTGYQAGCYLIRCAVQNTIIARRIIIN